MTSSAIATGESSERLNHAPRKAAAPATFTAKSRPRAKNWELIGQSSRAARSCSQQGARASRDAQPPLDEYYNSMFAALGPQHWWPGKTAFEVILGAILTQNTSWNNVEGALTKLRAARLLSPTAIEKVSLRRLERLIRSSGYYRQKARKLKAFCEFLRREHGGSLKRMFETPTIILREKLLEIFGIGPETADSILLYAGEHSVFPVDAYTRRLLLRHGWINEKTKYEDIRWMFERQFPGDTRRFNELHALIVAMGKKFCRVQQPLCSECSLGRYLEEGR